MYCKCTNAAIPHVSVPKTRCFSSSFFKRGIEGKLLHEYPTKLGKQHGLSNIFVRQCTLGLILYFSVNLNSTFEVFEFISVNSSYTSLDKHIIFVAKEGGGIERNSFTSPKIYTTYHILFYQEKLPSGRTCQYRTEREEQP